MHICSNLVLVSSVFSSSVKFFFSNSGCSTNCLLRFSLTSGCVRILSLCFLFLLFLPSSALKCFFFLFQVSSLLDYFLSFFSPSSFLRRAVNNEIYCANSLAYFCQSGQALALLCFCHLD